MPLPHNLYDYCSIRIFSLVEKYLVVKRKISSVDKADILLTKLIIRGGDDVEKEDWYFAIGVLMWLIDKIEHHIENKEKRKEKKKKTPKNKKHK